MADPDLAGVRTKPAKPYAEKRTPSAFWPIAAIVVPVLRGMASIRIRHPEKLPATGAFILAPNHHSNIDPLVVGLAVWRVGRAPRFLAKASLFRIPGVGAALRAVGQIPVERGGAGRGAIPMTAAKRLIEEGQGVIVYPEGSLTRDPDLWPMRGKTGAARLALQLGLPVIPAAHWGTQDLMPRYTNRLRLRPRSHIDVVFGDPVVKATIEVLLAELASPGPATTIVQQRLADVLVVQALRTLTRHSECVKHRPPALGALSDPQVHRALSLMHAHVDHDWTVAELTVTRTWTTV